MGYKYLDRWDIKLMEDNMSDLEDLLPVIDDLIGVAVDNTSNANTRSVELMDREYNI